ncbi:hypothetical protein GS885_25780, partial [Rhodococcus hoagii]|nr:hypothetical protein [Prescottella equi]
RLRESSLQATAVGLANGALDDQAFAAANKSIESSLSWITELGERGHTSMETLGHAIDNVTGNVFGRTTRGRRTTTASPRLSNRTTP